MKEHEAMKIAMETGRGYRLVGTDGWDYYSGLYEYEVEPEPEKPKKKIKMWLEILLDPELGYFLSEKFYPESYFEKQKKSNKALWSEIEVEVDDE